MHQVTYIVELYNHKENDVEQIKSATSMRARIIDYAIILTCLFPMAAFKISQGSFDVGVNDLTSVIPGVFQQTWFFVLMSGIFSIALIAYIIKTIAEFRGGYINWPKTVFVSFTVIVAFTMPALPNLDTAFQGLNTWHSFQYLAITFYIIKIRQQYGDLKNSAPLVSRFTQGEDSRGLYALSAIMLLGSLVVFGVVYSQFRTSLHPAQLIQLILMHSAIGVLM